MIQLLVISKSAELPKSIDAILAAPERFTCRHKPDVESTVHLLEMPLFGACLLDTDLTNIQPIRQIQQIRRHNAKIPLIVITGEATEEWKEEATLNGADFILAKPIRGTLLKNSLERIFAAPTPSTSVVEAPIPGSVRSDEFPATPSHSSFPALEILRDFSRIFSFTLNLRSFTYQFSLKLREITGVSRIAIFLEKTASLFPETTTNESANRLRCLCSVGIEPELFDYLTLSTTAGIGKAILRSGRILRNLNGNDHSAFSSDPEIEREFKLLGGQVAIPILNRKRAIGVAVLGDRLTGQPFSNEELELLFHLMEELGVAITGNLLHEHLLANHNLVSSVFSQLTGGCLVVDNELNVLHVNPAFLKFYNLSEPVEFSDLPHKITNLLYESAQHGKVHEPFLHTPESAPEQTLRVSIVPFQPTEGTSGAMISVEDYTPVEAARKAELKASRLEVIALIAERFAHEIRNAIVPIDTNRQLMAENREDPEFNENLEKILAQETGRISRLADQLLYLSRRESPQFETKFLPELLDEAFKKAKPLIAEEAKIIQKPTIAKCAIACDGASLTHAFFELLLNGFQANPKKPTVTVTGTFATDSDGTPSVRIEFADRGKNFDSETAATATEPFFTTRNVGVGLGLSVAKKIVNEHGGTLEIDPSQSKNGKAVSVVLPLSKDPD
ncbi:MAG TPA: ATP-binding protein [Opitutales bacterium]|nr:ATP-binding protein [Opitutales bacterium]